MSVSALHVEEGGERPGNWPVARERERRGSHATEPCTATVSPDPGCKEEGNATPALMAGGGDNDTTSLRDS